jgi:ribose 5-phosphate isomerase B
MSMAANKHRGIRAALCSDTFSARLTRNHNDANVLCIGARVVGFGLALDIVDSFLGAEFEGGRHSERVNMVMALEQSEG